MCSDPQSHQSFPGGGTGRTKRAMAKDAVVGIKAGVAQIEKEKRTAGGTYHSAKLTPPNAASDDDEVEPPIAATCEGISLVPLHVRDILIAPYRETSKRPANIRLNTLIASSLDEFHATAKLPSTQLISG